MKYRQQNNLKEVDNENLNEDGKKSLISKVVKFVKTIS